MIQKHLSKDEQIINGSFYTPDFLIGKVYDFLTVEEKNGFILDTSCGYGQFNKLNSKRFIGIDIDKMAIDIAEKRNGHYMNLNSLSSSTEINKMLVSPAVLIGNPPYNNFSSLYKKNEKGGFDGDKKYASRDLGISFLKSYTDLNIKKVVVLHPLSFLIKRSNFKQLKYFYDSFKLVDSYVFPSTDFSELKNNTPFPVVIAVYERGEGMDYQHVENFRFNIKDQFCFSIKNYSFIEKFHTKYKDKKICGDYKHFQTIRDINALSRNATFLKSETSQSIRVTRDNEFIFNYLEIFKDFYKKNINDFWYIGNLSPIILKDIKKIKSAEQIRKALKNSEIPLQR